MGAIAKPRPAQRLRDWIDANVEIPVMAGAVNPGPMKTDRSPIYRVQHQFQMMARGWVTMQIKAAGWFDAMQFNEARSHHGEIGHHR